MTIEPMFLTVQEAAKFLGVCRATLYLLIGSGRIEARKCGARTLIPIASLRAFADKLPRAEWCPTLSTS